MKLNNTDGEAKDASTVCDMPKQLSAIAYGTAIRIANQHLKFIQNNILLEFWVSLLECNYVNANKYLRRAEKSDSCNLTD